MLAASSAGAAAPVRRHRSPCGLHAQRAPQLAGALPALARRWSSSLPQRRRSSCVRALQHSDPYVEAARRLERLIAGVGDGEEELYESMLLEEDPENKLQVNLVLGAILITASTTICWLCGKDPAGGASFSLRSLESAAVGAAAALPLVASKLASWHPASPLLREQPVLASLRALQVEKARPWLSGMSSSQLGWNLFLDTVPLLFLQLPAAQAAVSASFELSSAAIGRSVGLSPPPELGFTLGLVLVAIVSAGMRATDLMTDPEQVAVVNDAVANADRYYKLTAGGSSASASAAETTASRAALAFKSVAVCWREAEQEVTSLAATLSVLDLMCLGCLWCLTQDMTAPCVAALLSSAVDQHYRWQGVNSGDGRQQASQQQQQSQQRGKQQRKQE